jgi:hypothetical protein
MNVDGMDSFFDHLSNMDKEFEHEREEFKRLCADPSLREIKKGSRVIVAIGFCRMGKPWERGEAEVMEVGETSVKVRFIEYTPYRGEKGSHSAWIHQALVTDVLPWEESK